MITLTPHVFSSSWQRAATTLSKSCAYQRLVFKVRSKKHKPSFSQSHPVRESLSFQVILMAPSHTRNKSIASIVMVQPTMQSLDNSLDPYAIVCPTFGCRGDCYVCDPERKSHQTTVQTDRIESTLSFAEAKEFGSPDATESRCPIWSSCQQKRARFTKKPRWMQLLGLTAITTAVLSLLSYGKLITDKLI